MNDFERRLSESLNAERARNEARTEADLPRIKGAIMDGIHRRKRGTWAVAIGVTAMALAAGAITVPRLLGDTEPETAPPAGDNQPSPSASPTAPAVVEETDGTGGDCSDLPFRPTVLPDGFSSYELQPGDGGQVGIPPEEQSPRAYGHYGGDGSFISVYETGAYYTLPAGWPGRISIFDQGAGFTTARLGPVEDGFALEFEANGCEYSAIGFGVTEEEMRTYADGLMQTEGDAADREGFALYPELTPADAAAGCVDGPAWRRDALAVTKRFAAEVLEIESPFVSEERPDSVNRFFTVLAGGKNVARVTVHDVGYECWSVLRVGPASKANPTVQSFSLEADSLELGLTGLRPALEEVYMAAYFAGENLVAEVLVSDFKEHETVYEMDLVDDPESQGAFLVLFRDDKGSTVGAFGVALPAYDTAAG